MNNKKRESTTSPRRLEAARKQAEALQLREDGDTFQQIADKIGYATRDSAQKAVMAALDKMLSEPAEHVRELELIRLDGLWRVTYKKAKEGDIKSVEAALKIMDRRARLTGLDKQIDQSTVVISHDDETRSDELDELIAEYQAKFPPKTAANTTDSE